MNGTRDKKRTSKKRLQIVETAKDLFMRFGIRRVTIDEICRTAGASKMTFYKYFSNKIALLKEIWNGWLEEGYRRLEEIDGMEIPFREKLAEIIEYKMNLLSEIGPEFLDDVLHGGEELREFVQEMRQRNILRFMKYVHEAQERGDMRAIRPEFFLSVLDKIQELAEDERLRKLYNDDMEFIREIQNFLFFGVLPAETR
ncbi:MAG: TetR/AcrR family transcriptional regulator [bacterium]|nr:MAG: TetR/AcrR family transcriptional regulator [bacterium]